jgi:hypothetical protein
MALFGCNIERVSTTILEAAKLDNELVGREHFNPINAIDFFQTVSIRISSRDSFCLVEICNDGEPIDDSILSTLFNYGVSKRSIHNCKHHGIGLFSAA